MNFSSFCQFSVSIYSCVTIAQIGVFSASDFCHAKITYLLLFWTYSLITIFKQSNLC